MEYPDLFAFLEQTERRLIEFFDRSDLVRLLQPDDMRDGVLSYLYRPAKRLRPAVLLMACGSVGSAERERAALPAAAGVEIFHTWTLVHDDLIDNDRLRRGQATVHEAMTQRALGSRGLVPELAAEYGRDIAILTGDIQHGWSVVSFIDCALTGGVEPAVILKIIRHLQTYVIGNLVYGEVLDVQFGMQDAADLSGLDEETILHMLWLKTGVLYEFAGLAGALIGKNTTDFDDTQVSAIAHFTGNCGLAFQLQDDILGILGDEKTIGKPVGSDIREGKKTVIVYEALQHAGACERQAILAALGNKAATPAMIAEVTQLFQELGGIARARNLAAAYLHKALPYLNVLPDSPYKRLLEQWADFMINRSL